MKAAVYDHYGGPEVLRYEDVAPPVCHPKGVLIRVEAISIEGGDLLNRSGSLPNINAAPFVGGRQAAGEVVEVGDQVTEFAVGQRVVATAVRGSHAELFAAPARTTWRIPDRLDAAAAAAIPVAFGTAQEALFRYGDFTEGQMVLVRGGAGGVGVAAIQMAQAAGAALVVATGSSDERLERLKAFGMNVGINHRREQLAERIMTLTEGRGVDLVVDPVAGAGLQQCIHALARGGRVVMCGQASREPALADLASLMERNAAVAGFALDIASPRVHRAIAELLEDCASGRYRVIIDRIFPLAEAAAAHAYAESRQAVGRILLKP